MPTSHLTSLTLATLLFACAPDVAPESANAHCAASPLAFAPEPGARYAMAYESPISADSQSVLSFAHSGAGWTFVENEFVVPSGSSASLGDLSTAEARGALDALGVPTAAFESSGEANPQVLPNLSFFAYRPIGYAFSSTCPGDEAASTWTDSQRRTRTTRFVIERVDGDQVFMHIEGSVVTVANTWSFDGSMRVSLSDGLSGETQVRMFRSDPPSEHENHQTIRIARAPPH